MKKLKLLQGLALTGVAATAGSMLVAPSALAIDYACIQSPGPGDTLVFETGVTTLGTNDRVFCGDKIFSDFDIDPIFDQTEIPGDGAIGIQLNKFIGNLGDYIFDYATASGLILTGDSSVQPPLDMIYEIAINFGTIPVGAIDFLGNPVVGLGDNFLADPDTTFLNVSLDSEADETADDIRVIKSVQPLDDIGNPVGAPVSLVSLNGDGVPPVNLPMVTMLEVTDTVQWGFNDPSDLSELEGINNVFQQKAQTPEPASMLGIIAVGGLALATRRKQGQK